MQVHSVRRELATSHLQMLKEITGVRGNTSIDFLFAELEIPAACLAFVRCQVLEQFGWQTCWHRVQAYSTGLLHSCSGVLTSQVGMIYV